MSAPNGKSANFASLNHCIPNGIPIIVIHKITPVIKWETAAPQPININHRILTIGCFSNLELTSAPNGNNTSLPILNNYNPNGIPIIVIHKSKPSKK